MPAGSLNKSAAYDNPTYVTRQIFQNPDQAAGASKTFNRFAAWTPLQFFSVIVTTVTAGTSSYTAWNGTATVTTTGTGDQLTIYRVFGNSGTATYGPYAIDAAVGGQRVYQLGGTATGTASYAGSAGYGTGGIALSAGDFIYCQRGTDATAVQEIQYEYAVQPGANFSP